MTCQTLLEAEAGWVWGLSTLWHHRHQLAAQHSHSECGERAIWLVRLTTEETAPEGTHFTQATQRPEAHHPAPAGHS